METPYCISGRQTGKGTWSPFVALHADMTNCHVFATTLIGLDTLLGMRVTNAYYLTREYVNINILLLLLLLLYYY